MDGEQGFPSQGRIAAIDFGTVRIGIAICDPDRILASPLQVIDAQNWQSQGNAFAKVADEERITGWLVGLPIHADGNESASSKLAREFASWIRRETGLPTRLFDERFTTVDANRKMSGSGWTRKKRKQRVDAIAATVLLESFLEACRYRDTLVGIDVPIDTKPEDVCPNESLDSIDDNHDS